jgi:hypothetical protein
MKRIAFFAYWLNKDPNMLESCINSLKAVCPDAVPVICTDGVPAELSERFEAEYGVRWIMVPSQRMVKRRATCKIEVLASFADALIEGEDVVLVSDVDIYYQADPFIPIADSPSMDVGMTTRHYEHLFPINGGIFYVRINKGTKDWLRWHVEQILEPSWPPYVKLRRAYNHERYGLDWSVGQDFLIACWLRRAELLEDKGLMIVDAGPKYNFCPPVDLWKAKAFQAVRDIVGRPEKVAVIHLKSDLKSMIYESGLFPNAKLNYPRGETGWL